MTTELAHRAPRMAMGALEDPRELGTVLAASGYFQDARDAAQAVVKVLAGAELGFGPIASMTGVYIVKGRVTLSANLMGAAIKRHPKYDYRVKDLSGERAEVSFFERGQEIGTSEFTMEDARRAGLSSGENWRKYPRNMLLWRALSNGAKFYCPDAFSGSPVYTPDELGADVDPETGEIVEAIPATVTAGTAEIPRPFEPADRNAMAVEPASAGTPSGVDPTPEASPAPGGAGDVERMGNASTAAATSTADPLSIPPDASATDPIPAEAARKLREVLDALGAPESFWRMALMSVGKSTLGDLTKAEATDLLNRAQARFGA